MSSKAIRERLPRMPQWSPCPICVQDDSEDRAVQCANSACPSRLEHPGQGRPAWTAEEYHAAKLLAAERTIKLRDAIRARAVAAAAATAPSAPSAGSPWSAAKHPLGWWPTTQASDALASAASCPGALRAHQLAARAVARKWGA